MVEIRIDNTGDGTWWLYGDTDTWKDYVCGEDFDEQVVLIGNRFLKSYTEASWYKKAKEVLEDIDCYELYPEDLSEEDNAKLKELYEKCRCLEDIIFDTLTILYPDEKFKKGTIYGSCQSDWQNYIVKEDVPVSILESFYFGKVADVTIIDGDEEVGDVITLNELWDAEDGDIKEYFRKRYGWSEDEEIHIKKADGYKMVANWEEIC